MRFTTDQIRDLAYKVKFFGVYSGDTKYLGDNAEHSARYIVGGVATANLTLDLVRGMPLLEIERTIEGLLDMAGSGGYAYETLGFWVDESTQSTYIDLGDSWYTEGRAKAVASRRGEKAIYDRIKGEVIHL